MESDRFSAAMPGQVMLTRRRKAALIVQMLLSDGGRLSLSSLPEPMQEMLALELASIRLVDRDTVNAVAQEFSELLSAIGLSAPGGGSAAVDALSDLISPDLASRLRSRFDKPSSGDLWQKVIDMDTDKLTNIMQAESIEVGAVILSKLPVAKAATVLSQLPGDRARRITSAVARVDSIAPDAVTRIGMALVSDYGHTTVSAFDKPPVARVGAILNSSAAATRDDVLAGLDSEDAVFAKGVRRAIFTFVDIPVRLKAADIPNITRAVDADVLSIALAAALSGEPAMVEAAEFILGNLSQRMANQMREDAAERGTVKPAAAEEAMNKITAAIRDQVDSGNLVLVDPDDDSEEAAA